MSDEDYSLIGPIHAQQDPEGVYLIILDQASLDQSPAALGWARDAATTEHHQERDAPISALTAALRQAEHREEKDQL